MRKVFLAQYRGIGPLSTAIKRFTRSDWSHSAIVIPPKSNRGKFMLVEAWGTKGVVMEAEFDLVSVLSANHRPGTPVDLFSLEVTDLALDRGVQFLSRQIGKNYDWALIKKFVTRRPACENDMWICSELAGDFFKIVGYLLQRMQTWKMDPDHCGISTVVTPDFSVTTI